MYSAGEHANQMKGAYITAIVVIILLIVASAMRTDGFRSPEQKQAVAKQLVAAGEPRFESLRNLGLDGAEYYGARQLWHKNKYTPANLAKVL